MDLVKWKRLWTEPEQEKPMEVKATHLDDMAVEDKLLESHFMWLHWTRATKKTSVRMRDVQEPVGSKLT